jgi:hypothetical protein
MESIKIYVGITVPLRDFATALHGPMTDDDFTSIYYRAWVAACEEFLDGCDCRGDCGIVPLPPGPSTELKADIISHDRDATQPLVIGIRLGNIISKPYSDDPPARVDLTFEALEAARTKFAAEQAKLADNPTPREIYRLIKDQSPRILFV